MAKGSVRKKGKKWYYRFYVEDESGNRIQKELPGTESKSETESLLRKAMEEYENQRFVSKTINLTLSDMLDLWMAEELLPSKRSNGTTRSYVNTANRVKQHAIGKRKLKTITAGHLQKFFDSLTSVQPLSNGQHSKPLCSGSLNVYAAVMRGAFRFAVFPKQLISFNPMQYVTIRGNNDDYELFAENGTEDTSAPPVITDEQYKQLTEYLELTKNPALLPIQIAYYTGLRLGEVCGLTWQDIDLEEQYLTVRRSICYNNVRKKTVIGPTKRKKIRTVDFCDTLAEILKAAQQEQMQNRKNYGELYCQNYYVSVKEKNRTYHEVYTMPVSADVSESYNVVSLVCLRQDGAYESPATVSHMCAAMKKRIDGFENFHFHLFRHTYTSKLLANGAAPKDVQELLGHTDINTTLNVYAHATRESKRNSAMLLDATASAV
ncbi:MAG: tyrosine-type recombinase/integrase [Selenomonadaceae bacterium]